MKLHKGAVILTNGELQAAAQIPGAVAGKIAGIEAVAIKHELYQTLLARNVGYDIPSPINHNGWQYPGLYPPRENQLHTAAFGTLHQRAFILNEMRTGKTFSALWAAEYLIQEGFIKRVLVVCLKTSLRAVWEQAMFECLPHRQCTILHGTREKRRDLLQRGTEFSIINHDGLMVFSEITKRGKTTHVDCTGLKGADGKPLFDLIIFDEGDVLCNHRTDMYKALQSLLAPHVWFWLMTGTPIPTKYENAWGLLKLVLNPKDLPVRSYTQFRELVMIRLNQYKWANREGARQVLFDLMQPAIRFTQAQCFDLPAVQEIWRECELSSEQKKLYREMQRAGRLKRTDDEAQVVAVNAAVKVAKLLQISSGAVKDEYGNKVTIDASPRIAALLSIFHELNVSKEGMCSVVFMPYKYVMEDVKAALEKKGFRVVVVNGDTPDWKRREVLREFTSDFTGTRTYDVALGHPEVMAHAVDLTASESVVWYAPCFGPRFYQQGNQRHQGAKQKGHPVIIHLTATRLEKERFAALQRATQAQADFLAMYERGLEEIV
jgi:SNF2 family DNA or RNA helicase